MARLRHVLLALSGVLLLVMVLYNAEVGFYEYNESGESTRYKLLFAEFASGDCSSNAINVDLGADRMSDCIAPLGTYAATDFTLAAFALFAIAAAPALALSEEGGVKMSRDMAKLFARMRLLLGVVLSLTGVADALGMLTGDGSQLDWEAVFGLPLPSLLVDVLLIGFGAHAIRKSLRRLKSIGEAPDRFAEPWERPGGSSQWKGSIERRKKDGGPPTVGDLRASLRLDEYEDIFQIGTSSELDSMRVGRKCHYCSGQGCQMCDFSGELA